MRPPIWNPPKELSSAEERVAQRIRKAKLFLFLRQIRHQLFDEEFQKELSRVFKDSTVGLCPVPPAQMALAILLQAYTGVSDDEAIEAMVMARRWQLVLDCLDAETTPFGKGTLVQFRAALLAKNLDRSLIEKTVKMAEQLGGYPSRSLRVALDSSPLWGAARVEDTYNLLGHALRKALEIIARHQQEDLATVAQHTNAELLAQTSLKAALDLDWDDPASRNQALAKILQTLNTVEGWVEQNLNFSETIASQVNSNLAVARQIESQDVEEASDGFPKLRQGVAKDRRISIEDQQMRHGRQSRHQRFDGDKRHVLKDLDLGVVRAVGLTPANLPEATITPELEADLHAQQVTLSQLHIDRAYLTSHWVKQRSSDVTIICKAWRVRHGQYFDKTAFVLDWKNHLIRCLNRVSLPFSEGQVVHFPKGECDVCPLRSQCTTSSTRRSVSIHPDESLLQELRQRQMTPAGRTQLRERVAVEHCLARIQQWQGEQARYLGLRKNLFDLRRMAAIDNLHVLAHLLATSPTGTASS